MPRAKQELVNRPISQLRSEFWAASNEELLDRNITAAGIGYSMGWMEVKAVTGGGVPFFKCGRRCLYRKSDALAWLEQNSQFVQSTSEYKKVQKCKKVQKSEPPA